MRKVINIYGIEHNTRIYYIDLKKHILENEKKMRMEPTSNTFMISYKENIPKYGLCDDKEMGLLTI